MYRICGQLQDIGHVQDLWTIRRSLYMYKICGQLQDMWTCTRFFEQLQVMWTCTTYVDRYKICRCVQDSEVSIETRKHYSRVSCEVSLFPAVS